MRKAHVLPIALMAFAIVGFLFVLDYSISEGKWPWSPEKAITNTTVNTSGNVNVEVNSNTTLNTNTADETVNDLKTYTSNKYGFSFSYPKAWDKQIVGCGVLPCKESSGFTPTVLLRELKAKYGNDSFWLTTFGAYTSDLSPKAWFDKNISPPTPIDTNQNAINSNPAYFAKIVTDSYTDREYVISYSGIIVHFHMREISIHYTPQGIIDDQQTFSQYVSAFDAIVHSLNFSPTADWKTYTNKILGFSIQIPKTWTVDESNQDQLAVYFKIPGEINQSALIVYQNTKVTSLNDWPPYVANILTYDVGKQELIKVHNYNAIKFTFKDQTSGTIYYGLIRENDVFDMDWNIKDQKTLAQVLSTLTFTK